MIVMDNVEIICSAVATIVRDLLDGAKKLGIVVMIQQTPSGCVIRRIIIQDVVVPKRKIVALEKVIVIPTMNVAMACSVDETIVKLILYQRGARHPRCNNINDTIVVMTRTTRLCCILKKNSLRHVRTRIHCSSL